MALTSSVVISAQQRKCLEAALNEMIENAETQDKEPYQYVLRQLDSVPSDARFMSLSLFESSKQFERTVEALTTTEAAKKDEHTAAELINRIKITVWGTAQKG